MAEDASQPEAPPVPELTVSVRTWSADDASRLPAACFLVHDSDSRAAWALPVYEGAGVIGPDGLYSERGPLNMEALQHALACVEEPGHGFAPEVIQAARALAARCRPVPAPLPVTVVESAPLEPGDPVGRTWRVVVIQEGVSANRYRYPAAVLRRDHRVFEGVPVAVSWAALDHHDPVGTLRDVAFETVGGRGAITATAEIAEPAARARLLEAYRSGAPYEFSIDAQVRVAEARDGDGQAFREVTAILAPRELTIVRRGAAGGRVQRLVASARTRATGALLMGTETPLSPASAGPAETGTDGAALVGDLRVKEAEARIAAAEARAAEALQRAEGLHQAAERRAQETEFRALLSERLAGSRLPPEARERVREAFVGGDGAALRLSDPKGVDDAIERERKYLARIAEALGAGRVTGCGASAQVGAAPPDRWQAAMDGFFLGRDVGVRVKGANGEDYLGTRAAESDRIARFRSFNEACEVVVNDGRHLSAREILRACAYWAPAADRATESYRRARESLTVSSFAELLGDSVARVLLEDYRADPKVALVRRLASRVVPIKDYRTNRRMRLGGYGLLPAVSEGGTYGALTSPTDQEATYAVRKYGGTEDITEEAIANDDVGSIQRIPRALKAAAVETLYQTVLDVLRLNSTLSFDSARALFVTTVADINAVAGAFSVATMNAARAAMRQQQPYGDASKRLGAVNLPKLWLGPPELEQTAARIFGSRVTPQDAGFNATEEPNLHGGGQIETHVVDYWTDDADCVLVADPAKIDTLELGFLGGQEEPQLFVQDLPNVGSVFNSDKITWKIKHVWGFSYLDWRPFYGFSR